MSDGGESRGMETEFIFIFADSGRSRHYSTYCSSAVLAAIARSVLRTPYRLRYG